MSAPMTQTASMNDRDTSSAIARHADGLILAAIALGASAAVALSTQYGGLTLAVSGAAAIALVALGAFFTARGTLASSLVLATCLMGTVALQLQIGRGMLELHFGVFVSLALLLLYRDWRPILMAAGVIAVHHVVFDRLQAAGVGVYCTPEADFVKILGHASYVALAGGAGAAVAAARQAFDAGDYRWAAELLRHVLLADSNNAAAKDLMARSYEQMGYAAESAPWRNFYLTGAQELRQ
eukprot:gene489-691_t